MKTLCKWLDNIRDEYTNSGQIKRVYFKSVMINWKDRKVQFVYVRKGDRASGRGVISVIVWLCDYA